MKFISSLILLIITTKALPDTCNYWGTIWGEVYPVDVCNSYPGYSEIGKCNEDNKVSIDYYWADGCQGTPAGTLEYNCTADTNLCDCSATGKGANTKCDSRNIKVCDCDFDPNCENPMYDLTSVNNKCLPDGDGNGITVDCDHPSLIFTVYGCEDCSCDPDTEYTEDFVEEWGACSELECVLRKRKVRKKPKHKVKGRAPRKFVSKWKKMLKSGVVPQSDREAFPANNAPLAELGDNTYNKDEYGDYGLSNMQFLLLNVLVSVVTCLLVIAICLTVYFCMMKCRNRNGRKGSYSFEKVHVDVQMDEEENMIQQDK